MTPQQELPSHLFLVRFWGDGAQQTQEEQEGQDDKEWSGRVQHILSGEARPFHDWPTLISTMLEMAGRDGVGVAEGPQGSPRIEVEAPQGAQMEVSK